MAELNDIQALATISTIVEESEVKVILTNSCFKAQAYLFDKLRKESKRQNEICHFINEANLKLKAEIEIAEQQIKSSLLGQEIIRMANVELNKEFLIAKGKKIEIEERIKTGKKKYEILWHESKTRFESLPLVRNLLKRKNMAQTLYNGLVNGKIQIEALENNIKTKKTTTFELDKSRILELAKYISHEMNRKINIVQEKSAIIFELTHEIDAILKENSNVNNIAFDRVKNNNNAQLCQNINETRRNLDENTNDEHFLMPKLQLTNFDLDINLEQLKIKKSVTFVVSQPKVITFGSDSAITSQAQISKADKSFENEYLSLCYKIPNTDNEIRNTQNYSKRKLINILDDVKLNKNEAYEIISRINPSKFETVNVIVADSAPLKTQPSTPKQEDTKMEIIELSSDTDNILMPPSQFLDMTQKNKKAVSFDAVSIQECIDKDTEKLEEDAEKQTVDTQDQLNNSVVSEEDFVNIKNRILKERHLDLSPQFVYAKNNKAENKIVTSKFFQNDTVYTKPDDIESNIESKDDHVKDVEEIEERVQEKQDQQGTQIKKDEEKMNSQLLKQPIRGMLFDHGSQCIPDSLNVSINTTCCEDVESDFPQFIDSSLLLSPKELPIPSSNNTEMQSDAVPHFLAGFRKTGLSFFGEKSSSDQQTENVQKQQNLFTFNFSSEEQKNKGGFFNMF